MIFQSTQGDLISSQVLVGKREIEDCGSLFHDYIPRNTCLHCRRILQVQARTTVIGSLDPSISCPGMHEGLKRVASARARPWSAAWRQPGLA